jgi:hypothetical protein
MLFCLEILDGWKARRKLLSQFIFQDIRGRHGSVYFFAIVEIICQRGVNLRQGNMRMGHEDLFRRPSAANDLLDNEVDGDPGSFDAWQPRTSPWSLDDMWIFHARTMAGELQYIK